MLQLPKALIQAPHCKTGKREGAMMAGRALSRHQHRTIGWIVYAPQFCEHPTPDGVGSAQMELRTCIEE